MTFVISLRVLFSRLANPFYWGVWDALTSGIMRIFS